MGIEDAKVIILDWHGVLDITRFKGAGGVEERLTHHSGELNSADLRVLHGRTEDYARGIMPPEEFWKFIGEYFSFKGPVIKALRDYYVSVDNLNISLWSELPKLKEKYGLAILSDSPPDKTNLIRRRVDLSVFEGKTYFSSDCGLTKNNYGFYGLALRDLDVEPGQCLFVDDSPKNIEYAQSVGLQACLYTDNDEFLKLVA